MAPGPAENDRFVSRGPADELSLATLERRLAAIASLHKEEGYESPASVAEGPLRKIWKGIVREKTHRQDGVLRQSELVALTTENVQFIEGEGVNVYVRRSKADQEGAGLVKGPPYGSNKETCPVTALRQWMQAAERQIGEPLEGDIFRRFYRGESIGDSAMTVLYVSTVLKRHAERAGLDPEEYSTHSLRAGFITQAIRAGKPERRVKEHSGHASWETFNRYVEGRGPFRTIRPKGLGSELNV